MEEVERRGGVVERRGGGVVSEFLDQNPSVGVWVETLRGFCETNKQWNARREFILRNLEAFSPAHLPGGSAHLTGGSAPQAEEASSSLDRLLSLSMVWANHVFLGCSYPPAVMERIRLMSDGIEVQDAPLHKTPDGAKSRGPRPPSPDLESSGPVKRPRSGPVDLDPRPLGQKVDPAPPVGPAPQAPAQQQPFFNRLYKAVAWRLVSAGGGGGSGGAGGPNLDHGEVLRSCVESCKQSLSCVLVPLRDIVGLPAGRAQKDGHVCEIRCQSVYLGTGYGRDEAAARAMASKEALKVFQGRKVTVKICRRRFRGREVEDLMLLDDSPRSQQAFPPALSYPFPGPPDLP